MQAVYGSGWNVFFFILNVVGFYYLGCNYFWFGTTLRFCLSRDSMPAGCIGLTPTLNCGWSWFIHLFGSSWIWSHMHVLWNQWQRPPVTNPLFSISSLLSHPSGWLAGLLMHRWARWQGRERFFLSAELRFVLWIFRLYVLFYYSFINMSSMKLINMDEGVKGTTLSLVSPDDCCLYCLDVFEMILMTILHPCLPS